MSTCELLTREVSAPWTPISQKLLRAVTLDHRFFFLILFIFRLNLMNLFSLFFFNTCVFRGNEEEVELIVNKN